MNEPKQEYRLRFLEKQYLNIGAHFEQIEEDNQRLFEQMQKGFEQAHAYIDHHMAEIRQDITSIKSTQEQILTLLQQKPD
jgi:hypothetical protein